MEQLGQYKIIRKLGAGAMGEVYLAEHIFLKTLRAVKILPESLSESASFRERFESEGQVLARLKHPQIVQVYDMGEEDGRFFFAMEFITPDGENAWSLNDLQRKNGGRLAPKDTVVALAHVCKAIAYAHERGVIHRDLKPSNLLIGPRGIVFVSDFGLAQIVGVDFIRKGIATGTTGSLGVERTIPPTSETGEIENSLGVSATLNTPGSSSRSISLVGTWHYIPPEVQAGDDWTKQGDIYSLGVLAYVLLTGRFPLGRFPMPHTIYDEIPEYWDILIDRALSTEPASRYGAISELQEDLAIIEPTLAGMITSAIRTVRRTDIPDTLKIQARSFVRDHKAYWTRNDMLEFIVNVYQDPRYTGIARESIETLLNNEKNQWLEQEARQKEFDALQAKNRLKVAEEVEHKQRVANEARRKAYEAQRPLGEASNVKPYIDTQTIDLGNGIHLEMVYIPAGEFKHGNQKEMQGRINNHESEYHVIITRGFWMGKYTVTQGQWKAVMNENPSLFRDDILPVERVSWHDVTDFILKINILVPGGSFRLPTEAEWEYACRAGSATAYCFGNNAARLRDFAWFSENSNRTTHPVGQKKPNAWDLYDMHGNVWEWCQDWYKMGPPEEVDPNGPSEGSRKVLRGGSWCVDKNSCLAYSRSSNTPDKRRSTYGFRLVRDT